MLNTGMRPLCQACSKNFAAVNGYHNGKRYYRSRCTTCIRRDKKIPAPVPRWKSAGYKRKKECDRCGFKGRIFAQLMVYHVDGNLNNADLRNLKTVCLNCAAEISRSDLPWKPGDLEADY